MPCLSCGSPSSRLRVRLTSTSTYFEIESALSLLRHLASEGRRSCRVLALTDSPVALGALSKDRSSSHRVYYLLRKAAPLSLCYGFQFDVVWVPTWGNAADAPSRERPLAAWRNALPELPPVPPARLLSQQAENELRQLKEPLDADSCASLHRSSPLGSSPPACSPAASFAILAASPVWQEPRYVQPALNSRLFVTRGCVRVRVALSRLCQCCCPGCPLLPRLLRRWLPCLSRRWPPSFGTPLLSTRGPLRRFCGRRDAGCVAGCVADSVLVFNLSCARAQGASASGRTRRARACRRSYSAASRGFQP